MTLRAGRLSPLSEANFLRQVTELAELRQWKWLHLRPAMTQHSWRTPISGPLGKGWPDLVLLKGRRLLFVELKRDKAEPTPEQWAVLDHLRGVNGVDVHVWRPADWPEIELALQ